MAITITIANDATKPVSEFTLKKTTVNGLITTVVTVRIIYMGNGWYVFLKDGVYSGQVAARGTGVLQLMEQATNILNS